VDGGATWTPWPQQPCPTSFIQLLTLPNREDTLVMLCEQGIYRSTNGGQTWQLASTLQGTGLAADYGNAGRALLAGSRGLWESRDEGTTWQRLNTATFAAKPQAYLPLLVH
jgi:photosystem II stability/assembly factor-like uncharacterized protein